MKERRGRRSPRSPNIRTSLSHELFRSLFKSLRKHWLALPVFNRCLHISNDAHTYIMCCTSADSAGFILG